MRKMSKKGAVQLNMLYSLVLLLVLVAMITGIGILILDRFSTSAGVTASARAAINAGAVAIAPIATIWLGLIVTIVIAAIILGIVIGSFRGGGGR